MIFFCIEAFSMIDQAADTGLWLVLGYEDIWFRLVCCSNNNVFWMVRPDKTWITKSILMYIEAVHIQTKRKSKSTLVVVGEGVNGFQLASIPGWKRRFFSNRLSGTPTRKDLTRKVVWDPLKKRKIRKVCPFKEAASFRKRTLSNVTDLSIPTSISIVWRLE